MPFAKQHTPYSFIDNGIKIDDEKTILSALNNPKTCTFIVNREPLVYEFAGEYKHELQEDYNFDIKKGLKVWRNDFRVFEGNITEKIYINFEKLNPDRQVTNVKDKIINVSCRIEIENSCLKKIAIEKGYPSDGSSYPQWLYKTLPFSFYFKSPIEGLERDPAVLHDILCEMGRKDIYEEYPSTLISLAQDNNIVHRIYHKALLENGVSKFKSNLQYQAVKYGCKKWGVK
jgi:hypothetical protein